MKVIDHSRSVLALRERQLLCLTARIFDFHLWVLGVAAIWLGVMRGRALEYQPLIMALLGILPLLAGLMVWDAVVQALWGTTPGQRWLNISLTTREGAQLSLGAHLRRNGAIWLWGVGGFIPPFFIISAAIAWWRLHKGQPMRYDAKRGYQMRIGPISQRRLGAFYAAVILSSSLLVLLVCVVIHALQRFQQLL